MMPTSVFYRRRGYCPWKKLFRAIFTVATLGTMVWIAFSTYVRRPSKHLTADANEALIQAQILEKNTLSAVMTNPVNPAANFNSTGNNTKPKEPSVVLPSVSSAVLKTVLTNNRIPQSVLQSQSLCPAEEIIKSSKVTKLGRYPQSKRFLSIGIASVARPNGEKYLLQTTQSLIDNMSDMDKKDTYIVIFLADLQDPPKANIKADLSRTFGKYIDEGLITVIEAYPEYYPALTNIKKKYGDSDSRRTWRSKENVDATFVMCYCKELSQYYIHLEDDVISSPSFFPKLQDFINAQKGKAWPMLDATIMGSKAKVFFSKDLGNVASYFYLMYDEMPIDWLMGFWRKIKDEKDHDRLPPASLFQHIGDRSSLQENGLSGLKQKEPFFDQYDQKYKGLNPPASVTSSMASHQGSPQAAYDKGNGYFWARDAKKDDYVMIKFNAPTAVREVYVETACHLAKSDSLKSAVLQANFAPGDPQLKDNNSCGNFENVGSFTGGKVKISLDASKKVTCLRILVTQGQTEWIYFREIDVW